MPPPKHYPFSSNVNHYLDFNDSYLCYLIFLIKNCTSLYISKHYCFILTLLSFYKWYQNNTFSVSGIFWLNFVFIFVIMLCVLVHSLPHRIPLCNKIYVVISMIMNIWIAFSLQLKEKQKFCNKNSCKYLLLPKCTYFCSAMLSNKIPRLKV